MREKPTVERGQSDAEREERQLYHALDVALAEQDDVMNQIGEILQSTPDRLKAEQIVLEKLAPLMDAATKKVSTAQAKWLEALDKVCKS